MVPGTSGGGGGDEERPLGGVEVVVRARDVDALVVALVEQVGGAVRRRGDVHVDVQAGQVGALRRPGEAAVGGDADERLAAVEAVRDVDGAVGGAVLGAVPGGAGQR